VRTVWNLMVKSMGVSGLLNDWRQRGKRIEESPDGAGCYKRTKFGIIL
jgi:hypothetical protein